MISPAYLGYSGLYQNQYANNYVHPVVNFKGQNNSLFSSNQSNATVSNDKTTKNKLTKGQKWAIGLGVTAVACVGARFGLQRVMKNNYKNIVSELPENIVFKNATSKEEALKFTRETLKIKDVEECFSLEELNFINKALTNVSNAQKGKCAMPKSIKAMSKDIAKGAEGEADAIACVHGCSLYKGFGTLEINREFLGPKNLDTILDLQYYAKNGSAKLKPNQIYKVGENIYTQPNKEYSMLLEKYYTNPANLTMTEKLRLIESYDVYSNNRSLLLKGIIPDNAIKEFACGKVYSIPLQSSASTIYHEMGHLQDLLVNKNAQIANPIKTFLEPFREGLNLFPPKRYKEFIDSKTTQEIAGKVSAYAQTSYHEFIAEVYSGFLSGRKFTDDVIALYKKYNGPLLVGM